jgi:surface antigen
MSVRVFRVSPASAAVLALALGGCATDTTGTKATAALAALPTAPVMSGTVSGGLISGGIGNGLDDADRQRAYDAEISALETGGPGYPIGWKGDGTARGTVIAGPPYNRAGYQSCRDYSHTIYIDNRPQIARGAACRTADGRWQPVS